MTQPEKLDLTSHHIAEDKKQDLLKLFPEIHTEDGKIDFDKLKLVLGETVDVGREHYGMTWPGKADCFKTIQAPSTGTLLPAPEESVDFETTENLIIEGDNLEVLKLLQKAYLGKIKMIYIDPPYNTGNDFIYPDNYTESLQTYLEYTGQVDSEGKKFGTNTEDSGRFHSRWLNMIYPRLFLARQLLRDDGVVFVSIDGNEQANLKLLMDEIFGQENFIENFVWKKSYGGGAKEKYAVTQHEYILMYAKNKEEIVGLILPPDEEVEKRYYKYRDEKFDTRGGYRLNPLEASSSMDLRENLRFPIIDPETKEEVYPKRQWWWSKERVEKALANNELFFSRTGDRTIVSYKQYLRDDQGVKRGAKPFSIIDKIYTQHGTEDLRIFFEGQVIVQFPKPVRLIKFLINFGATEQDSIIMDFFSGSATTAQAVLETNSEDGGGRKFILVQLPEPTDIKEFPTISEIGKERCRRVIKKLKEDEEGQFVMNGKQDRGFRVFKLAESNFKGWDAQTPKDSKALEKQLELHIEHVRSERMREDILYEILLKSGFPLTTVVEQIELEGKCVYSVADGGMFICLDNELTLEAIRAMAEKKPQRVVCLDMGFAGNDQLKANAVQIFKAKDVVFKTV